MTVEVSADPLRYAGNDVTTEFPFTGIIFEDSDLEVTLEQISDDEITSLLLGTDYTVSGVGLLDGGYITTEVPVPSTHRIAIRVTVPTTQPVPLRNQSNFSQGIHENAFDRLTRQVQKLERELALCLRLPRLGVDDELAEMPSKAVMAGGYQAYDALGNPIRASGTGADSALRTDLASTTLGTDGSRLVGYRLNLSNTVARSVYAALADLKSVKDFGAVGDGVTNDTTAIQNAINSGLSLIIPEGSYRCNNLTQSTNFQQLIGIGRVHFLKNANGDLLTSSGDDVLFEGIDFRNDDVSGPFTGKGLVSSGDRVRVTYCGGYLLSDTPLKLTGTATQVNGTCNIYQNSNGAGYDIEIGVSGTATLYHRVLNVYTGTPNGGIRFIDCGSHSVLGSQFGKLTNSAGTAPSGSNGGIYGFNRILGAIEMELSNSVMTGNQIGAVNVHWAAGTSGHKFDEANILQVGCTLDDDSNESYIVDSRLIAEEQQYTGITWTAASGGASVGNGSLTAWYTKQGRRVFFQMSLIWGSTTNGGTGVWTFTLPFAPVRKHVGVAQVTESGVANEGGFVVFASGVATFQVFPTEAPGNAMSATVPFTWGTGDELHITGEYYTD